MYILNDGTEVTTDQIKTAFASGNARLVHSNGNHHTATGLMLDGVEIDTRGQCHSVWDEVWTRVPASAHEALQAAYYDPAGRR